MPVHVLPETDIRHDRGGARPAVGVIPKSRAQRVVVPEGGPALPEAPR